MKFNFTVTSNSLVVTLDTLSGFLEPNIKEYFEPNIVLGNNRIYLKEKSRFVQDFPFEKIGLIATKNSLNLIDAYELLENLIKGLYISSGVAGSQDLQSVLSNGNITNLEYKQHDETSEFGIIFDNLITGRGFINTATFLGGYTSTIGIEAGGLYLITNENLKRTYIGQGEISMVNELGSEVVFKNTNMSAKVTFEEPNTPEGSFTRPISVKEQLANVNGDIDLDNKYIPLSGTTAGNSVSGDVELKSDNFDIISIKSGLDKKLTFDNDSDLITLRKGNTRLDLDSISVYMSISDINNNTQIGVTLDGVQVISSNPLSKGLSGISDFTSNIDSLDYVQKKYVDNKFAPANNNTTTNLSLTQLNTQYPSVDIGYKVHCMNILGVKLIYEKTSTGWCSYSVNIVS
jgi:hypothetical protein